MNTNLIFTEEGKGSKPKSTWLLQRMPFS